MTAKKKTEMTNAEILRALQLPPGDSFAKFQAATPEAVCRMFRVGKRTVAKWMKTKKIGFVKIGRSVRFLPEHLEIFTTRYGVKSDLKYSHAESFAPVPPPTKVFLTVGTKTTQLE